MHSNKEIAHASAPMRFLRRKPRLTIALVLGIGSAFPLPGGLSPVTRLLLAWNVSVWSYVAMMAWLMLRASPARVRSIAEREDPSAPVVLALMSLTAIASLAAIVIELASIKDQPAGTRWFHYSLTGSTLLGSWLALNAMFSGHYAHLYYNSPAGKRALRFPDGGDDSRDGATPNYWDFLYFSFTIAVAAQTSDVSVMTRGMRKAVLAQSVLSFLFNAAIIGMSINVAAGLVSG